VIRWDKPLGIKKSRSKKKKCRKMLN